MTPPSGVPGRESGQGSTSLRARLEEAEAILSAIRSGSVDAITTETDAGVRVFTLEGSEHPYRVIVETMTDGAVTVASNGLVLYCNEQFASMLDTDLETVVGSFLPVHFAPSDEARVRRALGRGRREGRRLTASLRTKDGKLLPVSVAMQPLPCGGPAATVVVLSDLTEVIAAQESQRQLQEARARAAANEIAERDKAQRLLETANQELESFSYSVSHDLRAPLRAIDGFSRALLQDYGEKLDAEGRRLANVICDGARQMAHMIDDILAFSRIGRGAIEIMPVDMQGQVRKAIGDLASVIDRRHVEFQIGDLPSAQGDPAMLQQVWANLLGNAVKYTGPRDRAAIQIGTSVEACETIYFVRDNGVGFDMRYADKLFGSFQRLHGAEFPGTGVGLSIVNRIVTRHGGRVWAEAEVDKGATFFFTLRCASDGGTDTAADP